MLFRSARFARADLRAVASADVVVFLADDEIVSRGMWVELGCAISCRRRTIVSGGAKLSIFTAPGCVDAELLAFGRHIVEDSAAWGELVRVAGLIESKRPSY